MRRLVSDEDTELASSVGVPSLSTPNTLASSSLNLNRPVSGHSRTKAVISVPTSLTHIHGRIVVISHVGATFMTTQYMIRTSCHHFTAAMHLILTL